MTNSKEEGKVFLGAGQVSEEKSKQLTRDSNMVTIGGRDIFLSPRGVGPKSPTWHTFDPIAEGAQRRAAQQIDEKSTSPSHRTRSRRRENTKPL